VLLDVGGHHHGLDLPERQPVRFAPGEKGGYRPKVGGAGVRIADAGGEELPEAFLGPGAPAPAINAGVAIASIRSSFFRRPETTGSITLSMAD
jgi:hypothetical protein